MLERKPIVSLSRLLPPSSSSVKTNAKKQQRLMLTALALLVVALFSVLYQDRDFWFPDQQPALEGTQPRALLATASPVSPAVAHKEAAVSRKNKPRRTVAPQPQVGQEQGPSITTVRTALPPLEVEVIAGDSRRTLQPGTNSVHLDLQSEASAPTTRTSLAGSRPVESGNMIKAAERVEVSPDTADVVTHSVTPGYPMLARQMKVQGSVILQAVIGRNGLIQELHVVSGPPILARAAQEAVRQWHFKPHYEDSEAVETQAKITVNFTISAN